METCLDNWLQFHSADLGKDSVPGWVLGRRDEHGPSDPYQMIAEAAYFLAERRGFDAGGALEDWLCAERSISREPRCTTHSAGRHESQPTDRR